MLPECFKEIVSLHDKIRGTIVSSKYDKQAFSLISNIMFWDFSLGFQSFHFYFQIVSITYLYLIVWLPTSKDQNSGNEGKKIKSKLYYYPVWVCGPYSLCLWKTLLILSKLRCPWALLSVWARSTVFYLHLFHFSETLELNLCFTVSPFNEVLDKRWTKNVIFFNAHICLGTF